MTDVTDSLVSFLVSYVTAVTVVGVAVAMLLTSFTTMLAGKWPSIEVAGSWLNRSLTPIALALGFACFCLPGATEMAGIGEWSLSKALLYGIGSGGMNQLAFALVKKTGFGL